MSLDIVALEANLIDEIASFTFSNKLKNYWRPFDLIKNKYDDIILESYDVQFDTYVFTLDSIRQIYLLSILENIGGGFKEFLLKIIEEKHDKVYIQIF